MVKSIVRNIAIFFLLILSLIAVLNSSTQKSALIYVIFCISTIAIYSLKEYKEKEEIEKRYAYRSIGYGILSLIIFYIGTLIIPGFSLGFPEFPAAVSDNLRFFFVNIVAPIVESIFFFGAFMAFIFSFRFFRNNNILSIILLAIIFSIFHLSAYIVGFENIQSLYKLSNAIISNISSFLAAFIFALITGFVLLSKKINMLYAISFHFINVLIYIKHTVIFSLG